MPQPSGHLRIVIRTDTYDEALTYLCEVLGLRTILSDERPDDDRVTILDAGRATLEVATNAHARAIDTIERSRAPAPQFRLALETDDTMAATQALTAAGATSLAPPTPTPWGSLNARVTLGDGIQLTVFQPLHDGPETGPATHPGDPHE
jgi:lactoylglutathione lyase